MRKIGRKDEFPEGKATAVEVDGVALVICRTDEGKFYALEDRCSHDDEELSCGDLEGCEVVCPRHGARFDIRDGSVTAPPAFTPIDTFDIEVRHGHVYVDLNG